jgi:hypothetical protein
MLSRQAILDQIQINKVNSRCRIRRGGWPEMVRTKGIHVLGEVNLRYITALPDPAGPHCSGALFAEQISEVESDGGALRTTEEREGSRERERRRIPIQVQIEMSHIMPLGGTLMKKGANRGTYAGGQPHPQAGGGRHSVAADAAGQDFGTAPCAARKHSGTPPL